MCAASPICCDPETDGWVESCVALAVDLCGLAPANDACEDAQVITDGLTQFTVTNAGTHGVNHPECDWSVLLTKDVWFEYVATCTGELTVSTCGMAPFQTWIGVIAGRIYLLRIGTPLPSLRTGTVHVSCKTAYDACRYALDLGSATGTFQFNNISATTSGPLLPGGAGCGSTVFSEVWYDWTAPCTGTLTVETCDQADFNTNLAVYSGCGCKELSANLVGCNNNHDQCGNESSKLSVPVQEGECYKVSVGGGNPGEQGTGFLTFSCTPGPPPNQLCQNAAPAFHGVPTPFSTVLASTDGPSHPQCGPHVVRDVWFNYTAECTGTLRVTTCGNTTFDARMALYYPCACFASDSTLLQCSDLGPPCAANGSIIQTQVKQGECYLMRIGGDPTGSPNTGTGSIGFVCTPDVEPCPGDLTGSGSVGVFDLLQLLASWGPCPDPPQSCPADLNNDGVVNIFDLLELLSAWGQCP